MLKNIMAYRGKQVKFSLFGKILIFYVVEYFGEYNYGEGVRKTYIKWYKKITKLQEKGKCFKYVWYVKKIKGDVHK